MSQSSKLLHILIKATKGIKKSSFGSEAKIIDDISVSVGSDDSKVVPTDNKLVNGKSSFEHIKKESSDIFSRPENTEVPITSDLTEERKASEVPNKPILKVAKSGLGQFNQTMR